jgi:hypothetical protein
MERWRWALASRIGTSHQRLGTRKQDAFTCFLAPSNTPTICSIVADGAGSAEFGGEGASLVCRILTNSIRAHFRRESDLPSSAHIWGWIDDIRDSISTAAQGRGVKKQSFASTLVMSIITNERSIIAHIGDGAIIARDSAGIWQSLSWPENGEYASTTYFITDDPEPRMRISEVHEIFNAFALFSDGIEALALDLVKLVPHQPFFDAMIKPLDQSQTGGKDYNLSSALAAFLDSERVCTKTDDDKSLILLSVK